MLLAGALALLGPATPASAQQPAPCAPQLSDPDGDFEFTNRDILGVFVRHDDGRTTVNMVLKEITFAKPSPGGQLVRPGDHQRHEWAEGDAMNYRVSFTVAGRRWYVEANAVVGESSSTATYQYGTVTGEEVSRTGGTSGDIGVGKGAVVSIAVPGEVGLKPGVRAEQVVGASQNVPAGLAGELGGPEGGDVLPGDEHASPMPVNAPGAEGIAVVDCAKASGVVAVQAAGAGRVVHGRSTVIKAQLAGTGAGGAGAELMAVRGGRRTIVLRKSALADGRVAFRVKPTRTTVYEVVAAGVRSAPVEVVVMPVARLDAQPRRGGGLRVEGSVRPAGDGAARLQRRLSGRWFDEATGRVRGGRLRIDAPRAPRRGTYRVLLAATRGHGALVVGLTG